MEANASTGCAITRGEAESEARLRALLEAAADAIISIDERGAIQSVNPAAERMFGYPARDLIGRNVSSLMPSPYREEHDGYLARYLATGEKRVIGIGREAVGLRKDGTTFPMDLSVAEARLGDWRAFVGIIRDLTERKRAEERFRLVVESAPNAIVMANADGSIVLVNRQAENFFGYRREELLGQPIETLVPERFRAGHSGHRASFFASPSARPMGAGRDLYGRRKDGGEFPVEIGLTPIRTGEGLFVLGSIVDITERKRAEEARSRLAAIVESSEDGIVAQGLDGTVLSWNAAAERIFGYSADEMVSRNISVLAPPDHPCEVAAILERIKRGESVDRYETVRVRKDGRRIDVSVTTSPLKDSTGKVVGASSIKRDITEQKRAQEALRESEARLRAQARILDLAQIFVRDLDDRIILWNRGAEQLYGWSREEALGQVSHTLLQTIFPSALESIRGEFERHGEWEGELGHRHKDGAPITVVSHWVLHRDEAGLPQAVLEVNLDVSEQKRVEADLRQSKERLETLLAELRAKDEEVRSMTQQLWQTAKLASVGELAAGIAHELNNPLATVSLRVESALARTPADDPRRRALEVVDQEVHRMGDLVANLLQFSRRGQGQISTVDIRDELAKAVELIHHLLRKRQVSVVQNFAPDVPTIYADRQKLRQVFLNLLTNAADAMPDGGTLTLRAAPAELEDGRPGVRIEVADTGVGIPAEHLDKVLDTFFTTKEEGKGTGLGLAICRRVVEEHHGELEIGSEAGRGTTVRVLLPVRNGGNVAPLKAAGPVG